MYAELARLIGFLKSHEPTSAEVWTSGIAGTALLLMAISITVRRRSARRQSTFSPDAIAAEVRNYNQIDESDEVDTSWRIRAGRLLQPAFAIAGLAMVLFGLHGVIIRTNLDDGDQHYFLGDYVGASLSYHRARRFAPDLDRAHLMEARCLIASGRLNAAITELKLASSTSKGAECFALLGKTLLGAQEPQQAAEAFETALQRMPDDETCLLAYGLCMEKAGDFDRAYRVYSHAVDINDQDALCRIRLATCLLTHGAMDEGIANCRKAVKLAPRSGLAHYTLATGMARCGDFSDALSEFRRSADLDPTSISTRLNMGVTFSILGQKERGAAEIETCLHMKPVTEDDTQAIRTARTLLSRLHTASTASTEVGPRVKDEL